MDEDETYRLLQAIEDKDKAAVCRMLSEPGAAERYSLVPTYMQRLKFHHDATMGTMTGLFQMGDRVDSQLSQVDEKTYKDALKTLIEMFRDEPGGLALLKPILDRQDILEFLVPEPRMLGKREVATLPYQAQLLTMIADIFRDPPPNYTHSLPELLTYKKHFKELFTSSNAVDNLLFWELQDAFRHVMHALPQEDRLKVIGLEQFNQMARAGSDDLLIDMLGLLSCEHVGQVMLADRAQHVSHVREPLILWFAPNNVSIEDEKRLLAITDHLFENGAETIIKCAAETDIRGSNILNGIIRNHVVYGNFLNLGRWMEAGGYEFAQVHKNHFDTHEGLGREGRAFNLLEEPLYLIHHLRDKQGNYPKPLARFEDKKEYLAMLKVLGMARALTDDATRHNSGEPYFRNLIANTPGTWSEIAERIKDFTPDDAFTARRYIHKTVMKRLGNGKGWQPILCDRCCQDALAYIFDQRSLDEMLAMGHGWNTGKNSDRALVTEDRVAVLNQLLSVNKPNHRGLA